jgi:DNA polymerase-3 subunit delta
MKLAFQELPRHLTKNLAPIYLVSGDEFLLAQEAVDSIRAAATQAGFIERIAMTAGAQDDWTKWIYAQTHHLSLFADKKIVEVNCTQVKLNASHGKFLADYANQPPSDTLLIVQSKKLEANTEKTAWYQAVEKKGVTVTVWPVPPEQLPQWLMQRARRAYFSLTPAAANRLAALVEGHLSAAAQEIEKLSLLAPGATLDEQAIETMAADNARFDIFNLVDSALAGNRQRCWHIIQNLAAEDIAPTLVLWALTRELRSLAEIHQQVRQGKAFPDIFTRMRIWPKRQPAVRAFLQRHSLTRCWDFLSQGARIDQVIKGVMPGNVWNELGDFVLGMAGVTIH